MRVLIVEDEQAVGMVLQDFLRELDHEAEVVPSAEEALPRLQHARPDLVLLDFRLPGMSGLEFLQLPQVRDSRVPIIVISGVTTEQQAQECLRLGALDFAQKPIPFAHLQRLVVSVELQAVVQKAELARGAVERRRLPRARVALDVRVRELDRGEWETTSVDLNVEAMKVRAAEERRPGPTVTLSFVVPDGDEPLEIDSLLIRVDRHGCVFSFLDLTDSQFERLSRLVDRLIG
jgi:DNA-binding response OmpR family regulator